MGSLAISWEPTVTGAVFISAPVFGGAINDSGFASNRSLQWGLQKYIVSPLYTDVPAAFLGSTSIPHTGSLGIYNLLSSIYEICGQKALQALPSSFAFAMASSAHVILNMSQKNIITPA